MDVIASLKSTNIPQIYGPTLQALVGRLEANRSEIEKAKRATFKYGQTERHKVHLDSALRSCVDIRTLPCIAGCLLS